MKEFHFRAILDHHTQTVGGVRDAETVEIFLQLNSYSNFTNITNLPFFFAKKP